ncbi:hypothetical protein A2U01_0101487, partial [Trifolium medium]|nr:hypothetical protein [Trifolium medium]
MTTKKSVQDVGEICYGERELGKDILACEEVVYLIKAA